MPMARALRPVARGLIRHTPFHLPRSLGLSGGLTLYCDLTHDQMPVYRARGGRKPSAIAVDADGTFRSRAGLVTAATVNLPRIESTGARLEGSVTNRLSGGDSEDLSDGWTATAASVEAATGVTAPDGSVGGTWRVVNQAANSFSRITSTVTNQAAGTQVAFAVWVRKATSSQFSLLGENSVGTKTTIDIDFQFDANGVPSTLSVIQGTATILEEWSGWYRVLCEGTVDAGETLVSMQLYPFQHGAVGADTDKTDFWGAQLEVGPKFASSYIPTTASSTVVRSADDLRYATARTLRTGQGTVVVAFTPEFDAADLTSTPTILDAREADNTDGIALLQPNANDYRWLVRSGGSNVASIDAGTPSARGTTTVLAGSWRANDFRMYQDGVKIGTDTSGAVPGAFNADMFVGQDNSNANQVYGNVAHLFVYERQLSDAEHRQLYRMISGWMPL